MSHFSDNIPVLAVPECCAYKNEVMEKHMQNVWKYSTSYFCMLRGLLRATRYSFSGSQKNSEIRSSGPTAVHLTLDLTMEACEWNVRPRADNSTQISGPLLSRCWKRGQLFVTSSGNDGSYFFYSSCQNMSHMNTADGTPIGLARTPEKVARQMLCYVPREQSYEVGHQNGHPGNLGHSWLRFCSKRSCQECGPANVILNLALSVTHYGLR